MAYNFRRADGSVALDAGAMREKMVLQSPVTTTNALGEAIVTGWATEATIWANVRAMSGAEMERVQQRWAEARFKVRSWFIPAFQVQREWRLAWGTRTLDILDAEDPDGNRREIVLICRELVD